MRIWRFPPFASIKDHSYIPDEDEILLSMGTVMKIESVTLGTIDNNYVNWVHLSMCRYDEPITHRLKSFMSDETLKQGEDEQDYLLELGIMLYLIGEFEKTDEVFKMIEWNELSVSMIWPKTNSYGKHCWQCISGITGWGMVKNEMKQLMNMIQEINEHPLMPTEWRPLITLIIEIFQWILLADESSDNKETISNDLTNQLILLCSQLSVLATQLIPSDYPILMHIQR
jgi:hypothetical protein